MAIKISFFLVLMTFLIGCSKEETQQNQQKVSQDENDNPADTNLTPEEKFSAAILVDFLGDSDDEDLGDFLETKIYKMGANYNGATVVEITPSTWLVSLEKDGAVKNYLLQKYVDFKSNEYYFSFKETTLHLTDVISRVKPKTQAGE
ncbi:MAG TPA: hypothetical protein PKE39_05290 [Ignavibacteria bacterium]|nr:hypothetical protein [Ignavibacteria bacterium]HMQ98418.1 hypothetical protein [Ignavibacteria bacterium]